MGNDSFALHVLHRWFCPMGRGRNDAQGRGFTSTKNVHGRRTRRWWKLADRCEQVNARRSMWATNVPRTTGKTEPWIAALFWLNTGTEHIAGRKQCAHHSRVLATLLRRDRLADIGTRPESQEGRKRRVVPKSHLSIQREPTPCEEALRVRWTGTVDLTRLVPVSQKITTLTVVVINISSTETINNFEILQNNSYFTLIDK